LHAGLCAGQLPDQTVRILVGFSPGVAPTWRRGCSPKSSARVGQAGGGGKRTGAGGNIATDRVAKAARTGYTARHARQRLVGVQPEHVRQASFDPLKDFAPIRARVRLRANVLVVPADVPAEDAAGSGRTLRAQGGTYAHAGVGTSQLRPLISRRA